MPRTVLLAAAAIMIVAACVTGAPVPPSPLSSSPITADGIILDRAPADLGCDSIGWPDDVPRFASLTFRIDPAAANHVTAESDTGVELAVEWAPGFEGGAADERVVRDVQGQVVLRDGEVIELPTAANPELRGYPICLTPTSVSVMSAPG